MKNAKLEKLGEVAKQISEVRSKRVPLSRKFLGLLSELPNEAKVNRAAVEIASKVQSDLRELYPDRSKAYGAVQSVEEISRFISERKAGPETTVLC